MVFTSQQQKEFDDMYNKLVSITDGDGKIVQLTDSMLCLMIEAGEAQVKHIHCKRVVPHQCNRGSSLMTCSKVFQKGCKILGVGFSLLKCGNLRAVCFGKNPVSNGAINRFVDMSKNSAHFATFDSNSVEAASVVCGHLNQFIAAIHDEVLVPEQFRNDEDLMGKPAVGDHLDRHAIVKRDGKDLHGVVDKGLLWTYIPYNFEEKYPKLPHLLQKALNVEHHIGEGESWDEQLMGIAMAIVYHFVGPHRKNQPDYNHIMRETLRSKPPRADDVQTHVNFCKKWGGGEKQTFAIDLCRYVKMKQNSRIVNGNLFEALIKVAMPSESMCPNFMSAILKCAATRGQSRNGVSVHIAEPDVKRIPTMMQAVVEANDFMVKSFTLSDSIGGDKIVELRGDMECDMVDFLFNKLTKEEKAATSIQMIVEKFIKVVSGETTQDEAAVAKDEPNEGQPIFDPSVSVGRQTVVNLGWVVGAIVRTKKDADPKKPKADEQLEIGYINDDGSAGLHCL